MDWLESRHPFIRPATPADAGAVALVSSASFSRLYRGWYPEDLLDAALPILGKANPDLLASGTYYVAELDGHIVGCGGWSERLPGGEHDPAMGHIRHMATHPDFLMRGVGRALIERCLTDASERELRAFECKSSFPAEAFYARLGFRRIGLFELALPGGVMFPGVRMLRDLP